MIKISIVIPNYQGRKLLEENLSNIISSGANEVIINDDASNDGSVEFLKENYPQIKLLANKQNKGFIYSVNRLFEEASGEVVVLLNNDIKVDKNFLKPLLAHFSDKKVFAVNIHERGEGYSVALWKDGFFQYQKGKEENKVHKSSWASGGSAAFSKKLWQNLGGFDPIYYPGYWEDVDISYRAIKSGYQVLWEPGSKAIHKHGTIFFKIFKKRRIDWIQQRNQLLFIWKNIDDPLMRQEHWRFLVKRLLGKMGLGYWIPFLWALTKKWQIKKNKDGKVLTDKEAIDYVNF